MFEELKKILSCWKLQSVPEKRFQREGFFNYLGYKFSFQKIRPHKV